MMSSSDSSQFPADTRGFVDHLLSRWTWRMAWRDTRLSRGRLLLFSFSIVLGIAALTAIGSLGDNLQSAIAEQAKSLLGADLAISSREKFTPEEEQLFKKIGGAQSRETSFSTMIYFVRDGGTRLINLRGLSGGFPFYGNLETEPASAGETFRKGNNALVEESLLTQFHSKIGESIRLGEVTMPVAGELKKVPGETVTMASIAPRVYISMDDLKKTGLLRPGSLVRYRVYFKFAPGIDVDKMMETLKPQLDKFHLNQETVAERKRELGRSIGDLYHFLNLVGFIALLLGGVGIASSIHVHVKQKLPTVALLRCLGCSISQTFSVYLAQGIALGAIGSILGAAIGIAVQSAFGYLIQSALPRLLDQFIPFNFSFAISWEAVVLAMVVGFVICILFALLPLLSVRRISPLAAIRISFETTQRRDPWRWLVLGLLTLVIAGFATLESRDWRIGLGFTGGLAAGIGVLALVSFLLVRLAHVMRFEGLPFVWRQGLGNLHRPNNRTLLLLLSLGLGTFLIVSLYLVQGILLGQMISPGKTNQANTILFDIQADQRESVVKLVEQFQLPVMDEAPIVTMRLSSIKGRTVEAILSDKTNKIPRWSLTHEYRSTYNDHLRDGERLLSGKWIANTGNQTNRVPISLEQGVAKELRVSLNDEIVFDIQGIPMITYVASLREVDWRRIQPNFFVVFPRGVLEEAPSMNVLVTRVPSAEVAARFQGEAVKQFPNVSIIDLRIVIATIDSILSKISFAVKFMAMFTVFTGFLVLAGVLLTGRYQRIQESVLLRTLGASRRQILEILFVEYLALGFMSALTGVLLALASAWALCRFVFEAPFVPAMVPLLTALVIMPALTVVIGLLMSLGILKQPPLAILRGNG